MKKFMLCFFMMCVILFSNAYAAEGLAELSMGEVNCYSYSDQMMYGYFEIKNETNLYHPELKYVVYLVPERLKGETVIKSAAKTSEAVAFSLSPLENKTVAFELLITNIPTGSYSIGVEVYDDANDLARIEYAKNNFELGNFTQYISSANDKEDANYYKIKGYEKALSGPYMDNGKSPDAYIKVKSSYQEKISVTPEFTVYERDMYYGKGEPVSISYDEEIEIKAGETKELKLKLPVISKPGSYFIKVRLLNDKSVAISDEYYFRYVVNGISAKVASICTMYDKYSNVLKIYNNILGSADGQEIKNSTIETGILRADNRNIIDRYIDDSPIQATSYMIGYSVKLPDDKPELVAYIKIKDSNNKVLAEKEVNLDSNAIYNAVEKFNDIKDTNYELAVKMLNSYGVISGYPDGTFKPAKTLSRAELTSIALNMLKVDLSNYEVKSNAFTDVPESHWAYKSINYAYENGIINGYGNGLFKPNNEVKYSEAITILINVIGYGENAKALELTWPNNYINMAKELYITDDTYTPSFDFTKPANRGDVANLALNSYIIRRSW